MGPTPEKPKLYPGEMLPPPLNFLPQASSSRFIWASGLACFVPSRLLSRTFGAFPVHDALLESSISRDFTGWPKQFVQNSAAGALAALGGRAFPHAAQPPVTLGERTHAASCVRATLGLDFGAENTCGERGGFINRKDLEAIRTRSSQLHPRGRLPGQWLGSARRHSNPSRPRLPDLLTGHRGRGLGPATSPRSPPPPPSGFSLTHGSRPLPLFSLTAGAPGGERVSRPGRGALCVSYAGSLAPGSRAASPAVAGAAKSAISGPLRPQASRRALCLPSSSAQPAACGGVRRRRASASSSVSRCGRRSSLHLLFGPPLASLLPLPELRRVPATLGAAAGTKEDPAAAAAAAPPPPAALTRSRPAAAAPGRPTQPSRRPRPGVIVPASRANPAFAFGTPQGPEKEPLKVNSTPFGKEGTEIWKVRTCPRSLT
nr:WAS/WASL-interacting protein family member 2-like [Pongo pygmaeus]